MALHFIKDTQCDNLQTPDSGNAYCTSGKVGVGYTGDTCGFTCNTGYELTGSNTRTCQSDGSWSGSDNNCISKFHLYIHTLYHTHHTILYYQCLVHHFMILTSKRSIVHWEKIMLFHMETLVVSHVTLVMS